MKTLKYRLKKAYEAITGPDERQKDPLWRLGILSYQFGDMSRWIMYRMYYGESKNPQQKHGITFYSDLLIQVLMLGEALGFDIEKCLDIGIEKMLEQEFKRKK
jgi:hypothetical protein